MTVRNIPDNQTLDRTTANEKLEVAINSLKASLFIIRSIGLSGTTVDSYQSIADTHISNAIALLVDARRK